MKNRGTDDEKAIQDYFDLNAKNYKHLVDELLAATSAIRPTSDPTLLKARRQYFKLAIGKGAELSTLPASIAKLSASKLTQALENIPDKKGPGWKGMTSLTSGSRLSFNKIAKERTKEAEWDNLFPKDKNEIILPFSGSAQSFDEKIDSYITKYNEMSAQNFIAAQEADRQEQLKNPNAWPKAGKDVEQRQIRLVGRVADKSFLIQSLNPNAKPDQDPWQDHSKVGKFLQDRYEWELYDLFWKANTKPTETQPDPNLSGQITGFNRYIALKEIANRVNLNADDVFNPDDLRVVVSRDPQKLGEMSTGQRWRSCMAQDGINFHFVPADIKAGSLVAYVVHKDDLAARWPLMRQLIKPFRNNQGETVLVPAKIYGGDGSANSRTRDALQSTLLNFVARQNGEKAGEFQMDPSLYSDGQSQVVNLKSDWSEDSLREALQKYQKGSLEEWRVELKANAQLVYDKMRGPHDEDPADTIKKLKSQMRRVFDAKNIDTGLPRMFFREAIRTSIGSTPHPRDIERVSANDGALNMKSAAFSALSKPDQSAWQAHSADLWADGRKELAFIAGITAEPNSASEQFALEVWQKEIESVEQMNERMDVVGTLRRDYSDFYTKAPIGSNLQNQAWTQLIKLGDINQAPRHSIELTPAENSIRTYSTAVGCAETDQHFDQASDLLIKTVDAQKKPFAERFKIYDQMLPHHGTRFPLRPWNLFMTLADAKDATTSERISVYSHYFDTYRNIPGAVQQDPSLIAFNKAAVAGLINLAAAPETAKQDSLRIYKLLLSHEKEYLKPNHLFVPTRKEKREFKRQALADLPQQARLFERLGRVINAAVMGTLVVAGVVGGYFLGKLMFMQSGRPPSALQKNIQNTLESTFHTSRMVGDPKRKHLTTTDKTIMASMFSMLGAVAAWAAGSIQLEKHEYAIKSKAMYLLTKIQKAFSQRPATSSSSLPSDAITKMISQGDVRAKSVRVLPPALKDDGLSSNIQLADKASAPKDGVATQGLFLERPNTSSRSGSPSRSQALRNRRRQSSPSFS